MTEKEQPMKIRHKKDADGRPDLIVGDAFKRRLSAATGLQYKNYVADVGVDDQARSFTATITTDAKDRDGEVLLPQGMDPVEFSESPTIFWNHDYDEPIGIASELNREQHRWTSTASLVGRPPTHVGEWKPDTVYWMMKQKVVRGVSVGFQPIESRKPTKKDIEMFGDGISRVYSKWKLLEFSVTPMQSNQQALIQSVKSGAVTAIQVKSLFNIDLPEPSPDPPKRRKVYVILSTDAPIGKPRGVGTIEDAVLIAVAKRRGLAYIP